MAESTSKLREQIKALTNVTGQGGFDIMEDEDTFKSTYDIMLGIGEVWEKMSDIDQAALLELLAGKRQGNALAATLTNLKDMQKALEVSQNSAGSATREHEVWLNSIEAKTQQFKASFESLSTTVFSTDFIKGFVDAGTGFVQGIDNMIQGVQEIPTVAPALKSIVGILGTTMAANSIGSFFFAQRGEKGSRVGNIGKSFKTTGARINSVLRDGGMARGQFTRAGAKFSGSALAMNEVGYLGAAAAAINPYTAAILGLAAAFVAVTAARKQYLKDISQRRERAEREYDEYEKKAQSIEDYRNRVKELRAALDSGDLSSEESLAKRTELVQIQQALVDLVGAEAANLDLVNGKLSEQLSMMDRLSEAEYKIWRSQNADAINRMKQEMGSGWTKVYEMDVRDNLRNNKDYLSGWNKLVSEIRNNDKLGDYIADQFSGNATSDFGLNLSKLDAYEARDALTELSSLIEKVGRAEFGENWRDFFGGIVDGANEGNQEVQKLIDTNEAFYNDYAVGELKNNPAYKESYSRYLDAQQEFYDAYEKGDREGMRTALEKRDAYVSELSKINDPTLEGFLERQFSDFDTQFEDLQVELGVEYKLRKDEAGTKELVKQITQDLGGKLDVTEIANVGFTYGTTFNENSADLTGAEQAFLKIKQAADDSGVSVGTFLEAFARVNGIELNDDLLSSFDALDEKLDGIEEQKDVTISAEVETSGEEELTDLEAKQKAVEGVHSSKFEVTVDGDGKLVATKKAIDGIPEKKQTILATVNKTKKTIDTVKKAYEKEIPKKKQTVLETVDKAKKTVGEVKTAIGKVPTKHNTTLTATDSATPVIQRVKNAIANVSRNITIWLTAKLGGLFGGKGEWTGTTHATEGLTLVGERGEELVQSKDKAYFVGTDHPEIVYLKQGDIVYNAEETKQIKSGNKVVRRGVMPALASGTDNTGRLRSPYVSTKTRNSFNFLPANGEQGDNFKLEEQLKDALDAIDKKVKESLNNYEHQILIMEKNHVNSNELIKVYKDMQAEVARVANDYRAKGLNENSNFIQDLQKQWYEYADKIKELTVQQYEEARKLSENAIDLNTNWLNRAVENMDHEGILRYSQNIVQNYKYMQEQVHEQAQYYRSLGYTDTSDEVSELSKLWYEYRDKIIEATSQAYAGMVDSAGQAVDNMQSLYSTLLTAGEEYAKSKHVTIDTFQDIVGLGTKYLTHLINENGQLVINEESIKRVLAAKTKELAINEALNYVAQIRAAVESGNIDQINALCDATNDLTDASWKLVYAQLSELNISDEQYRRAKQNINYLHGISTRLINNIDEELDAMKGDVGDILEYVKEMVKQEVENHIEALEEQVKNYNDIVNLQKESLKLEKDRDEYSKKISKQTKDIAELQAKIEQLRLDDSREALAQRLKLEEELAEKQENLHDDQSDHAYNATVDALDKMAKAYEEEKNKEIKILQNTISSEEKIYQMAIARIDTGWDNLYNDLIKWNTEYGSHINLDITDAWEEALKMAQKYGDYLTFLNVKRETDKNGNTTYTSGDGGRKDIVGEAATEEEIRRRTTEMYANSQMWIKLDKASKQTPEIKATKNKLADRNSDLADELEELIGESLVRGTDGVWYLGKVGGRKLYSVYPAYTTYHKGGIVGDKKLFDDEQYALLQKGEVVLTPSQQENLYRRLDAFETMYDKFGKFFNLSSGMPMNTSLYSPDDIATMRGAMTDNSVTTLATTVNVSIHGAVDDAAMAKKYGEQIGNETIKSINDAFYKRGINRSGNVLLKQ